MASFLRLADNLLRRDPHLHYIDWSKATGNVSIVARSTQDYLMYLSVSVDTYGSFSPQEIVF